MQIKVCQTPGKIVEGYCQNNTGSIMDRILGGGYDYRRTPTPNPTFRPFPPSKLTFANSEIPAEATAIRPKEDHSRYRFQEPSWLPVS